MREKFLQDISKGKNSVFLKGWLRRLNGIQYGKLINNK
nr:MAG TPA: putative Peptidoglycan domain protein [Bacteriophage sp.]